MFYENIKNTNAILGWYWEVSHHFQIVISFIFGNSKGSFVHLCVCYVGFFFSFFCFFFRTLEEKV